MESSREFFVHINSYYNYLFLVRQCSFLPTAFFQYSIYYYSANLDVTDSASLTLHANSTNATLYQTRHDDTIDDLASRILSEDTSFSPQAKPTMYRNPSRSTTMPQLPVLQRDGDDDWKSMRNSFAPAAKSSNDLELSFDDSIDPISKDLGPSNVAEHSRKPSAPIIPRRSSKRRSDRPQHQANVQPRPSITSRTGDIQISGPTLIETPRPTPLTGNRALDIENKIKAMLEASETLKAGSGAPPKPSLPDKRMFRDKMMFKVKSAFNLNISETSHQASPLNTSLISNAASTEEGDFELTSEGDKVVSSADRRVNEGEIPVYGISFELN